MAKVMLTSFFQVIFNTCFPGVTLPRPGPHEAGIFSKPRMLAVVSRRAKRNFGKKGKHIWSIYGKYMVIIWLMMVNNGNMGGFHKWWYPRWMVYSMENPIYKWMTTSSSPYFRKPPHRKRGVGWILTFWLLLPLEKIIHNRMDQA